MSVFLEEEARDEQITHLAFFVSSRFRKTAHIEKRARNHLFTSPDQGFSFSLLHSLSHLSRIRISCTSLTLVSEYRQNEKKEEQEEKM